LFAHAIIQAGNYVCPEYYFEVFAFVYNSCLIVIQNTSQDKKSSKNKRPSQSLALLWALLKYQKFTENFNKLA
jgi:hypothetical protein